MPSNSRALVADSDSAPGADSPRFTSRRCDSDALRLPSGRSDAARMLRRLPAPDPEPPFDDESPVAAMIGDGVQGTLALAFALPSGVPAIPASPELPREDAARRLRLVPTIGDEPGVALHPSGQPLSRPGTGDNEHAAPARRAGRRSRALDAEEFGPQQTPRALLPEPKPWAGRLVQAIIEVTGGVRPIGQLVRWTTTEVYDSVRSRCMAASSGTRRAGGQLPRRLGAIVRSVHVNEPTDGVAEVCAVVQQGARCHAIALRLEGIDGRWQCTALQLG